MREYYLANKSKFYENRRKHQKANPAMYNNKELVFNRHKRHLAKKYNLLLSEIEALYLIDTCQICKRQLVLPLKRHLDHDHKTGKLRGVLCNRCNHMLGQAQDDPETLRRAAKYLEERNV